jgi:hypothetical protein
VEVGGGGKKREVWGWGRINARVLSFHPIMVVSVWQGGSVPDLSDVFVLV